MSILRPMRATDLFEFNNINLDLFTETYSNSFYLSYLAKWPDLCATQTTPTGRLMGYVIGKSEGQGTDHHGHLTALTVAPEFRRLALATSFMSNLEFASSSSTHHGYFLDLFVRCNNLVAIDMYEKLGYTVFRRVVGYYQGIGGGPDGEDAFDMRKCLPRDVERKSIRPNGKNIRVKPSDVWF
ncbi:N-acetyltransferase [Mrakia frigida]|uniref:peptide alpha-N-acetyltransferase complex B subunit NAT3 n=1 Tax=Mrakia frigida TaxID=29902 RepID=UPI003FCC2049